MLSENSKFMYEILCFLLWNHSTGFEPKVFSSIHSDMYDMILEN